jgi:hypothetical protein
VSLSNFIATDSIHPEPPNTLQIANGRNGPDTILADSGKDIPTGTPESTTARESGTTSTTVRHQPKEQGILIDIVKDENDDRSLEKLIDIRYLPIRAGCALKRHNYDLEKVCLRI